MALTLSRIDRVYRTYDVGASLPDGTPVDLTAVVAAALAPSTTPTSATAWSSATKQAGYRLARADGALISSHATFAEALAAWGSAPMGSQITSPWRVLLAGPDADPTDVIPVPVGGADLWIKVADTPEVDAELVERISVR